MNNNLNILKEKAQEFSQAFAMYLESNETLLQDNKYEEKINQLLEQNAKIIEQNNQIITMVKLISESLNNKDIVLESKANNESLEREHLSFIDTEPVEQEPVVEITNQDEIDKQEHLTDVSPEQPITSEEISTNTQEQSNDSEPEPDVTKPEPVQEEKQTSSVLEFLHNRVINDNSKNNKDIERETKNNNKTKTIEGDLFATNQPTSIFEQFENKKKSDLRMAVGVSEKFLFINDLFSGNIRLCNKFINELNDCTTLENSMQVIDEYQKQYKWPKTSLAYTTLESLVSKRFNV